jgi:hypothetical protein
MDAMTVPRELTLYLLDSKETSEFCAWLYGKVQATPDGYVAPPWARVTIEREDRIKPALQRLHATVPDAWTPEIEKRLAVLLAAGLVMEMPDA